MHGKPDDQNAPQAAQPYRYEPAGKSPTDDKALADDASTSITGNYRWAIVGMLWFICFFNYADRQAISAVLPLLEKEFSFSKFELGLISGAFMVVYGLSAPLAGMVGDRVSRKLVILAGLYVWSTITGFTAACSRLWQFVLVRGAEGLGETFYFPASMSLVSDYHGQETRSRAMSLHQTSVYAGIIGGGVLTGWLADNFGWKFPFICFGVAGIVLGLVLARYLREPARNAAERMSLSTNLAAVAEVKPVPWTQFAREYLTNPASLCLLLAFVGANTVAGVLYTWLIIFYKDKFNLSLTTASIVGTVFIQVAAMVGSATGGFAADYWRRGWLGGRVGVQALGIFCGIPMILLCTLTTNLELAIAAMVALGLCKGIYDSNIWPAIYEVVPPSRRSSAVGMANMVGWVGAFVGTLGLGAVVDSGVTMSHAIAYTAVIYAGVAVLLAASAIVYTPRHIRAEMAAAAQTNSG
jgi:MFS family permease